MHSSFNCAALALSASHAGLFYIANDQSAAQASQRRPKFENRPFPRQQTSQRYRKALKCLELQRINHSRIFLSLLYFSCAQKSEEWLLFKPFA
jgi:hypothetical protein